MLARKSNTDSTAGSPNKMGLFTIALVMCVCCLSSYFTPGGADLLSTAHPTEKGRIVNSGAQVGGRALTLMGNMTDH